MSGISRAQRWIGFVAFSCGLAFLAEVGLAEAGTESFLRASPPLAAYREGARAGAPAVPPELPEGAEELLGLSVLAVVLYGMRAADLGGGSRSS